MTLTQYVDRLSIWCADAPRWLKSALDWWLDGLIAPLPDRWRARLAPPPNTLELRMQGADELTAAWTDSGNRRHAAVARGAHFAAACAELGVPPDTRVVVVLDEQTCLRRRLVLPLASARMLRGVVANEVERLTPIAKHDLRFEYRIAKVERAHKQVLVDIFVTRAALLDELEARLAAGGWPIAAITAEHETAAGAGVNFARKGGHALSRLRGKLVPRWSAAAAAAALVALLFLPQLRYGSVLGAAEREIDRARASALEARAALEQRDGLLARDRFIGERRAAYVPVLNALHELTAIVPEHTWLQQLDLVKTRLELQGESASASSLLQVLERSPMFADAAFAAPISPLPGTDKERFVATLNVVRP